MTRDSCTIPDCPKPQRAKGYCTTHLQRVYRNGTLELTNHRQSFCTIPGCTTASRSRGLCHNHWMRAHRMRHDDSLKQLALNLFPVEPLVAEIERVHLSHRELARRSQVPCRTILRVLNGQKRVTYDVADRLCYAIGTHPIFLWGDKWIEVAA